LLFSEPWRNGVTESFHILIVDDEEVALNALGRIMRKEGYHVVTQSRGDKSKQLLNRQKFDVVLTDLLLDTIDGLEIMAEAKRLDPETEVIIITGHGSVDGAIDATKKGAFHYLQKPVRPDEVRNIVRQAVQKRALTQRVRELENKMDGDIPTIIGNSPKITAIKKLIRQIAGSDANILITGESGTGKELVAKAIHQTSRRNQRRFLAFNCASFTEELIANELFGHDKDAYTGATQARAGLLESADGGTVFFDEVGDMPPSMQAKILRVVQEKELLRVGATQSIAVDIRIISATNKDLKGLCTAGIFRNDLYFRLNVIPLHLPSLAERREDIPLLATYFLKLSAKRTGKSLVGFSDEALGLLLNYGYPGNVRELENIIERATALAKKERIESNDLPSDLKDFNAFTFHRKTGKMKTLEEIEQEYIQWVLEQLSHNKSEASKILGIDRVSLYRKLKRSAFKE
jgi:DNA-binding NtrC family response regulator